MLDNGMARNSLVKAPRHLLILHEDFSLSTVWHDCQNHFTIPLRNMAKRKIMFVREQALGYLFHISTGDCVVQILYRDKHQDFGITHQ